MEILIPSHNRSTTISTYKLFQNTPYPVKVFVHNDEQYKKYVDGGLVKKQDLIVTHQPINLPTQRQWIMDNYAKKGEWYLFADDNIRQFQVCPRNFYKENELLPEYLKGEGARLMRNIKTDTSVFLDRVTQNIEIADAMKIELIGFATVDNPYFRKSMIRYVGVVVGKFFVVKNNSVRWDTETQAKEDYAFTARHLYLNGMVMIDNSVFRKAMHWQEGGIGDYEQRLTLNKRDVQHLLSNYGSLFTISNRPTRPINTEVRMRYHTFKQIQAWRKEMYENNKSYIATFSS